MPQMLRPSGKAKKIADRLLGKPQPSDHYRPKVFHTTGEQVNEQTRINWRS